MLLALTLAATAAAWLGWSRPQGCAPSAVEVLKEIESRLPLPHIPHFHRQWISQLSGGALAVALPGPAGGVVDRQGHRPSDRPAAQLQPAMPRGRTGERLRRVLPLPARLRLADPLGDQLSGGRGDALVGRVRRDGRGGRGLRLFGPLGRLHSQGGPGRHSACDRGRPDRPPPHRQSRAGEPLRCLAGAGHRRRRGAHRRGVFHPDRRRPVDPHVRAPRRPTEILRADRRRRSRDPRPAAGRPCIASG